MNSEHIAQKLTELRDIVAQVHLELGEVNSRLLNLESIPVGSELSQISDNLSASERLAEKHAQELEVLTQIVRLLTDRLNLLEKGSE